MAYQQSKPKRSVAARAFRLLTTSTIGILLLTSCGGSDTEVDAETASAQNAPLRLADDYAPTHTFVKFGASVFIEEMEDHGLPIDYYPAGQMGTPEDIAVLLENEVIDLGATAPAYLESKFPLSSVSDLPSEVSDSCVASHAMMELLGEDGILYEEEFEPRGLRPLWVAVLPGYELQTATKRVETPEDAHNLLIRSAGGALDATTDHIGARAVSMPGGDAYEAMARHTVDGVGFTYISAYQYGLESVATYSTDGLNMGSFLLPYVITEETWNDLNTDQQEIVLQSAEITNQKLCEGINNETAIAKDAMGEGGLTYVPIEGENAEAWAETLEGIRDKWTQSMDEAGMPGTEVLAAYDAAVAKHE